MAGDPLLRAVDQRTLRGLRPCQGPPAAPAVTDDAPDRRLLLHDGRAIPCDGQVASD
jgi:hypothetical protein